MANTDGQIVLGLDIPKTVSQINADLQKLEKQLKQVKATGALDTSSTVKKINAQIDVLQSQLKTLDIKAHFDTNSVNKTAQQSGQQIGNAINQGVSNAINKANNTLKPFSDLKNFLELNKSINDIHIDSSELKNYKVILDEVKNKYSEFGQVRITNEIFKDGVLEKFKVNIEQVNGDLKETKSFIMALNDEKDTFMFSGLINGSESIVQHLDKTKNAVNQTAEAINALKDKAKIDEIQLSIDNGYGASEYQNRINATIASLERYGVETQEAKNITESLQSTFDSMKGLSGQELVTQADKFEQEFKAVKISVDQAKLAYDKFTQPVSDEKVSTLILRIQRFLDKNTNITKEAQTQLSSYIQELNGRNISLARWNEINAALKKTESAMSIIGRLGKSFTDQIKEVGKNISSYLSITSVFMTMFSKTKESISELKNLDSILTEISKTSDLTAQQLEKLGDSSFKSASKYGKTASDYLVGIQEMARSGFYGDKGTAMAEQSLLAQAAGDMSAELANKYILATNAAYKYNGEAEKLNAVLNGQNSITNRNSVGLEDMAEAMSEAGTVASSYRVSVEDLSAMIGTIEAVTKSGGSEVGNSLKSILINLQNISSDKIVDTLNSANASMIEFENGAEKLRNPIDILRDLSKTFNQLDENDALRAEILTNIGGKHQAAKLAALLQNMDMFDKMLVDYSEGSGSAMEEAIKSANNWEGTLNKVNNTWTSLVNNFVNSDGIIAVTNVFNGFLSVLDEVINKLGSLGTIGLGTGLFAGVKNTGKCRMSVRIS